MKASKKNKASDLSTLRKELALLAAEEKNRSKKLKRLQARLSKRRSDDLCLNDPLFQELSQSFYKRSKSSHSTNGYIALFLKALEGLYKSKKQQSIINH